MSIHDHFEHSRLLVPEALVSHEPRKFIFISQKFSHTDASLLIDLSGPYPTTPRWPVTGNTSFLWPQPRSPSLFPSSITISSTSSVKSSDRKAVRTTRWSPCSGRGADRAVLHRLSLVYHVIIVCRFLHPMPLVCIEPNFNYHGDRNNIPFTVLQFRCCSALRPSGAAEDHLSQIRFGRLSKCNQLIIETTDAELPRRTETSHLASISSSPSRLLECELQLVDYTVLMKRSDDIENLTHSFSNQLYTTDTTASKMRVAFWTRYGEDRSDYLEPKDSDDRPAERSK